MFDILVRVSLQPFSCWLSSGQLIVALYWYQAVYIASCLQRTTAVPAVPAAEHHKDCGSASNSNAARLPQAGD